MKRRTLTRAMPRSMPQRQLSNPYTPGERDGLFKELNRKPKQAANTLWMVYVNDSKVRRLLNRSDWYVVAPRNEPQTVAQAVLNRLALLCDQLTVKQLLNTELAMRLSLIDPFEDSPARILEDATFRIDGFTLVGTIKELISKRTV